MKKIFLLAPLVLLSGCSEKSAAKDAVSEVLFDSDSAKFGEVTIVQNTDDKRACVTVNARNRFGGYTGKKQMTLIFDEESKEWVVLNDLELTHERCVELVSEMQSSEEASSDATAEETVMEAETMMEALEMDES